MSDWTNEELKLLSTLIPPMNNTDSDFNSSEEESSDDEHDHHHHHHHYHDHNHFHLLEPNILMVNAPESFDWRSQGVMTSVKDQQYCGSCYAFAGAGALEAYLKWKTGATYDLSEQDIVDCSYRKFMGGAHNNGCQGGWPSAVYDHYNAKGLVFENQYPYTSGRSQRHGSCRASPQSYDIVKGRLHYRNVRSRTEDEMKQILVSKGPLIVALAADNSWKPFFDNLGDGVFENDASINAQPNHAVVLVGYGTHKGKDYWLIKNSWGTGWAVGGYGKIRRGRNMCGIMTFGVWYIE
eukprot:gene8357-10264_t